MKTGNTKEILRESRTAGVVGTIVFHAVVLFLLVFFGLRATLPDEEEGLTVNYGTDEIGSGLFEPAPQSAIEEYLVPETPAPSQPATEPTVSEQDLLTQDSEESLALKAKQEEERKKAEEQRRIEAEKRRQEEEKRRAEEEKRRVQEEQRQKAMAAGKNAFGSSGKGSETSTAQSQGQAAFGSGNQGKTDGVANSNNYTGGGSGSGHNYSLAGRSISGRLPEPAYNKNEEGVIVVSIEVDGKGNVISAKAGAAGTTIGDATMRRSAEQAALKAKFNGIDEDIIQSGTITYRYKLN